MIWIKNLLLFSFSGFIALALFEIGLTYWTDELANNQTHSSRLLTDLELHDHEHHFCYGPKDRLKFDPELMSQEHPDQQYFEFRNQGVALHTYDEYGYRITVREPSSSNNVIVLGDSFARGTLADDTETIPSFLTTWTDNIVFFNFGSGGYGPTQNLINYKRNAKHFNHEYILLLHYLGNDADDEFYFDQDLKLALDIYNDTQSDKTPHVSTTRERIKQILENYKLGELMIRIYRLFNNKYKDLLVNAVEIASFIRSPIEDLVQLSILKSKALIVVTIPSKEVYDEIQFSEIQVKYKRKIMSEQKKIINELAKIYSLQVLHLDEIFADSEANLVDYYGSPDSHFNEHGYHAAAVAIADFLINKLGFKLSIEHEFVNRTLFYPQTAKCPN